MTKESPIIEQEESRLQNIIQAAENYATNRRQKLAAYKRQIADLKRERLDSVNWHEKKIITEKIREKEPHNPAKYLAEFNQQNTPYFAAFCIVDENPRIGNAEYLLGRQSLFKENKVVIIDWRQAAISALYYEYEPDEEYEEEINGQDRIGQLTRKRKFTISAGRLRRIECSESGIYTKNKDGWQQDGHDLSSSDIKNDKGDHHLVDIISLISPEQFRMITNEYHGCLKLLGSAGAGKTTIALHRLSYLLFNYPEKFRPERCLVLMFNRALRDYVASTVQDLISQATPVETFHSWAINALRGLGLKKIYLTTELPAEFERIKKSAGMAKLVNFYANSAGEAVLYEHLPKLYSSDALNDFIDDIDPACLRKFSSFYKNRGENVTSTAIGFADVGIILRLLQIRLLKKDPDCVNPIMNYYDHLVIDEAQDLSQVELECLLHATTKERSLTICADPNQQILQAIDASGLDNFQLHLQKNGLDSEDLQISYRSTAEIMAVVNMVLAKTSTGQTARHGAAVEFKKFNTWDTAALQLRKMLLNEQELSPNGLIAVVCKFKGEVAKLYNYLRDIRGVRKETQSFQPGILLINAHQVKGLEFTAVLAWNVSAKSYRDNNHNDRNLLYVVLSRACDRLSVLCHEKPTSYLQDFFGASEMSSHKKT